MALNVGDKIRFLNDVGGGIVRSVVNELEVIVEMQDGFEIPAMMSECVLISSANEAVEAKKPIEKTTEIFAKKRSRSSDKSAESEFKLQIERLKRAYSPNNNEISSVRNSAAKSLKGVLPTGNYLEIDLHINKLLVSTAGMNSGDMLRYQLDYMNRIIEKHSRNRGMKIVFIHGKGDGVLRAAIMKEFKRLGIAHRCSEASFKRFGHGALMLTM